MPALSLPYQIRRVTIDPTVFTPVIPPVECRKIVLSRGSDDDGFYMRSDPNDSIQEKEVATGWSQEIAGLGCYYPAGAVVTYVKAKTLTGALVMEMFR